jgi:hypothetical protein
MSPSSRTGLRTSTQSGPFALDVFAGLVERLTKCVLRARNQWSIQSSASAHIAAERIVAAPIRVFSAAHDLQRHLSPRWNVL